VEAARGIIYFFGQSGLKQLVVPSDVRGKHYKHEKDLTIGEEGSGWKYLM